MLFKIRDASEERKYLITASNLTELTPLTLNKSSKKVLGNGLSFVLYGIIVLFVYIFSLEWGLFWPFLIDLSFPTLGNLIKKF